MLEKLGIAVRMTKAVGEFNARQDRYRASITIGDLTETGSIAWYLHNAIAQGGVVAWDFIDDEDSMYKALGIMAEKENEKNEG